MPGAALTVGHELLGGVNSVSNTFVSVTSEGARFERTLNRGRMWKNDEEWNQTETR